ncbi:AI-2E family transporter [Fundicoccus culcitae]|uniref:AI-2E family transporter n=1 Tax=Fundicoccus culcitae TaxID=2969821 RepID=A0ABY5P300_9LACT|nr:AI-2E family transporter [Fundicoccus culcitae]UUX32823.1 AI-2E family transporter [Fundicoccus culcitae]
MNGRDNRLDQLAIKYLVLIAILAAIVLNYNSVLSYLSTIWRVLSPILSGFVFAFILNLLMTLIEKYLFPTTTDERLIGLRRPLAILLTLLVVLLTVSIILWLIIPQLISAIRITIESLPLVFTMFQNLLARLEEVFPEYDYNAFIAQAGLNWDNVAREITSFANGLVESMISVVASLSSYALNFVIILVISVYALFSKEKLIGQFKRIGKVYLKPLVYSRILYIVQVTTQSFSNFMTGMLIEAVIYGSMVTIGMLIFRFPYAAMIGTISGAFALIPMVGAIISAFIGFLLIMTQSLSQAFLFLLFIIVVQQLESNIIYPRVVGGSIGLPGIWTFIAVTLGGGLLGGVGFFIGVPIASTIYKLLRRDVEVREEINVKIYETQAKEEII